MDKKELVVAILKKYSCLTGNEISFFAKRLFNETISTGSAAGVMRYLISRGKACKQMHPVKHKTVYWLTEDAKNEII